MSGPKVVRIVTREEILAICQGHLQRLAQAMADWTAQAARLGGVDTAQLAATQARHARLQGLLVEERFSELQKAVPEEIEFLRRDLREREGQAIERAAQQRQRMRQVRENAQALLKALEASRQPVASQVLEALAGLRDRPGQEDADAVLARGFAALAPTAGSPTTLSEAQQALAQQLKGDAEQPSYAQWLATQGAGTGRDERLLRIDRYVAQLQLLQGAPAAQPFLLALQRAEQTQQPGQRALLLDSLVIDLASATRAFEQVRERLQRVRGLAGELHALADSTAETDALRAATQAALRAQLDACGPGDRLADLDTLIAQAQAALDAHAQALAAQARREAVLRGLSSLGYEVREGMATGWAQTGRVVLRKPATPGYGVEVGGQAEGARLQVRAVAFDPSRDKARDLDVETLWCGDFQRLQALLGEQGDALLIEQARAVGEVPLKEVAQTQTHASTEASLQRRH